MSLDDDRSLVFDQSSKVATIMAAIPGHVVDIMVAIPYAAEACATIKPSEFEQAQVVEALCKDFGQPGKKTSLAKTLKDEIRKYRAASFQRSTVAFGSVALSEPVPRQSFPDSYQVDGEIRLSVTVANLEHLLHAHGIVVEYDILLKKEVLNFPEGGISGQTDLAAEAAVQLIRSLASNSGISMTVVDFLPILLDRRPRNHVIEWIKSATHDGRDRVAELAKTITVPAELEEIWPIILKIWLLQCVAAADGSEHTPRNDAVAKYESVLVLVGPQGLSKTTWLNRLVPDGLKRYLADGMHLRVGNRDSEKAVTSFWLVELGEVDATFRKSDIANLKAFLSRQVDTMRLSYARRECSFKRRTSFAASVNAHRFLTDVTGNRRFWPIQVEAINHQHKINLQQLWRQVWDEYIDGAQWWPCSSVERHLAVMQAAHAEICPVQDALSSVFDLNPAATDDAGVGHWSCKELAREAGIDSTRSNVNRIGELMREHGFTMKTIKGKKGFYILNRTP